MRLANFPSIGCRTGLIPLSRRPPYSREQVGEGVSPTHDEHAHRTAGAREVKATTWVMPRLAMAAVPAEPSSCGSHQTSSTGCPLSLARHAQHVAATVWLRMIAKWTGRKYRTGREGGWLYLL